MRIGTGLYGADLAVLHSLYRAIARLDRSGRRLSTMQRINRGSDDPAGLIAAGQLRAELTALEAASRSTARAQGIVRVADSGLSQVSGLLRTIRDDVLSAAGGGLSDAEMAAKQIEVDAAVEAIGRIASSTSCAGRKLLDGSADGDASGQALQFVFSSSAADISSLSLPSVDPSDLGGAEGRLSDLASGGGADLQSGDLERAMAILDAASMQVVEARARAGAFEKYSIESSQQVIDSMEVSLSEAYSRVADTDVAVESSRLVQARVLVEAGLSALLLAGQRRGLAAELLGR